MAFVRPSLSEIVDRVQEDFRSRLGLVTPILRRSLVWVLSRVVAGAAHMLHGHLEYLSKQIFPDLAEREYLLRWGALFGLSLKAAEYATGDIMVTGTNGTEVPDATVLIHADGTRYATNALVTIATLVAWAGSTAYSVGALRTNGGNLYKCITAGTSASSGGPTGTGTDITDGTAHWCYIAAAPASAAAVVSVTAEEAGADGNRDAGVSLSFESPIAGADSAATVGGAGLADGSDEEDLEDFRARVLERMQSPPHGGSSADYVAWAKEVAGVTRAWCYPLEGGAGTVTVRFVRDDDASLIPDSGEVAAVQAHIDSVKPATATVTVAAPIADALNFTIHVVPDTSEIRAAVQAELQDLLLRVGEPGVTLYLSQIETAVGNGTGVDHFTISAPSADVTHSTGHIATMGTLTWT